MQQPLTGPSQLGADLFHYTNATALVSMIKNRELWATESNYLNDPSEIEFAANRAIDRLRDRLSTGLDGPHAAVASVAISLLEAAYVDPHTPDQFREDRAFITSFSRSDTSLTLWRNYAGANGFCIGFAEATLLEWTGKEYPTDKPGPNAGRDQAEAYDALVANYQLECHTYDVHYVDDRIESIVDDVLALGGELDQRILEARLRTVFKRLVETKHQAYSDEREARLVLQEVGHFAPDPHVRVTATGGLAAFHKLIFPFEAVRSITVAPGANAAQTTLALRSLMRAGGRGPWSHVTIRETGIPFTW